MMTRPKNRRFFLIMAGILLSGGISLYSCSKDDSVINDNYQLEGTWQLYQTTTGVITDSIYTLSDDNELVFAPQYYWRYENGALTDSGTYHLTDGTLTDTSFNAQINYYYPPADNLTLKGDTLILNSPGITMNARIYIKSSGVTTRP
jgi:hypothetical protein